MTSSARLGLVSYVLTCNTLPHTRATFSIIVSRSGYGLTVRSTLTSTLPFEEPTIAGPFTNTAIPFAYLFVASWEHCKHAVDGMKTPSTHQLNRCCTSCSFASGRMISCPAFTRSSITGFIVLCIYCKKISETGRQWLRDHSLIIQFKHVHLESSS